MTNITTIKTQSEKNSTQPTTLVTTFPKNDPNKNLKWHKEHEGIFIDWCDKAMCYRWLHRKCHKYYSKWNAWFTIPVIIMSTITGTTNFATEYFPEDSRKYVPIAIGSVNIIAGIIGTIHQFLKVSEINEAHRVSYISWDKFYRNIRLELHKKPEERLQVNDMLRYSKEEYDRLIETSPRINDSIIDEFNKTFKNESFIFPEICNHLTSAQNNIYQPDNHININIQPHEQTHQPHEQTHQPHEQTHQPHEQTHQPHEQTHQPHEQTHQPHKQTHQTHEQTINLNTSNTSTTNKPFIV